MSKRLIQIIDKSLTITFRTVIFSTMLVGLVCAGIQTYHVVPKTFKIPIHGEILPGSLSLDTFEIEYLADSNTTLVFDINSPGGVTYDTLKLVNAIRLSPAKSVAVIHHWAASAAAVIALSCDEMQPDADSVIIFHQAYLLLPDMNKYIDNNEITTDEFNHLIQLKAFPVLSADEQMTYTSGHDLWLDAHLFNAKLMMKQFFEGVKLQLNASNPIIYRPAFNGNFGTAPTTTPDNGAQK